LAQEAIVTPETPLEYTNEINKLRVGAVYLHGRERAMVEITINTLQVEAAFNAVDLILSGRPEDEQAIIDWARAACGMDVG
jgi:hypothetical protein